MWQACTRHLFAAAAPLRFVSGPASLSAAGPLGLVDGDPLMDTIQQLSLDRWPTCNATQYDALVVQPLVTVAVLSQDESNPARVWREGRAQSVAMTLHPRGRLACASGNIRRLGA